MNIAVLEQSESLLIEAIETAEDVGSEESAVVLILKGDDGLSHFTLEECREELQGIQRLLVAKAGLN